MSASATFRAIILGAPASGKGTISERIVRDFKLKHLSGGDLLRTQIARKTDVGLKAKSYMEKGQLVPDDVISKLIIENLKELRSHHWLLDGFPRTKYQAEYLSKHESINVVLALEVPTEEIVQRIAGRWTHIASGRVYNTSFNPPKIHGKDDLTGEALVQRDDDKPETVRKRLQAYETNIGPIMDFYKNAGLLVKFQGRYTNEIWPQVHK